jgi:hypothetical protein
LCHDLFRDETLASHLKEVAAEMMVEEIYQIFLANYAAQTGTNYPTHS